MTPPSVPPVSLISSSRRLSCGTQVAGNSAEMTGDSALLPPSEKRAAANALRPQSRRAPSAEAARSLSLYVSFVAVGWLSRLVSVPKARASTAALLPELLLCSLAIPRPLQTKANALTHSRLLSSNTRSYTGDLGSHLRWTRGT